MRRFKVTVINGRTVGTFEAPNPTLALLAAMRHDPPKRTGEWRMMEYVRVPVWECYVTEEVYYA